MKQKKFPWYYTHGSTHYKESKFMLKVSWGVKTTWKYHGENESGDKMWQWQHPCHRLSTGNNNLFRHPYAFPVCIQFTCCLSGCQDQPPQQLSVHYMNIYTQYKGYTCMPLCVYIYIYIYIYICVCVCALIHTIIWKYATNASIFI